MSWFSWIEKNCKDIGLNSIGAMDETPLQVEMPTPHTVSRKGEKSVCVKTRGKEKNRFTAIPAAMMSGEKLKLMIIFKGLKNLPKGLVVPTNIHVTVAMKGSMNRLLMNEWKREVWGKRLTPMARMQKSVILFDSYGSHIAPPILASFQRHYKTTVGVVPGGMTPLLQGIDTHINKSLKSVLKQRYKEFMRSGEAEYTRGGNKKGPSYQQLVDWCSVAWREMDTDLIKRSFTQTSVTNSGEVQPDHLHSKLRALIGGEKTVEELRKEVDEEQDPSGLTDDEEDSDEEEEEEEGVLPDI